MIKTFKSPGYNFIFNMENGFFARWGRTEEDDPEYSPFGPEILDIEISTICSRGCKWCYKSNGYKGENMSLETFKTIFDKFPKHLTQIAFGIGDIDGNPDLWKIMKHCRENNVIPNITINGERMTDDLYDRLVKTCGAVAVSHYSDDDCYNAVYELNKRGLKQVNIHQLLSGETYNQCRRTMIDSRHLVKLRGLNAIVFLMLKPKGERNTLHKVNRDAYQDLVNYALDNNVPIGFDSCTAPNFLRAVEGRPNFEEYKTVSEPCESTLFSYYINVDGIGFPCSFSEGNRGKGSSAPEFSGVDVVGCEDFIRDVWNAEETQKFRTRVMNNKDHNGCRMCPVYDLGWGDK